MTRSLIIKLNQPKAPIQEAEKEVSSYLEDPHQPFDVTKLARQIEAECVYPNGYNNPRQWGADDGSFSHCVSLVIRIDAILTSPAFSCVFRPTGHSLLDDIDGFLKEPEERMLRVSMSGVAQEFKAREIVANAVGRALLNRARKGDFDSKPLLVIVDEAHWFLGRSIGTEDYAYRLDAFELIAKEGRKYQLAICLATQRPRDITEGVLSQMGTLIIHRLTNDRDRDVVERACGEMDKAASAFVPSLKQGEAIMLGTSFPIPLTIRITRPETPPISEDPDFQQYWAQKDASKKT